jgi:hypothetical protein
MKKLIVTLLFLFVLTLGFGQQVSAPDPKEFTLNTSGQNASGFSLNGFNSTATLLCAVGLPVAPAGTTFYFTTTSGVTASTGYTMSGNKTRISFTGTQANINAVLASMKINTTGTAGDINISVSATVNPVGYYYLPTNGHFYRPISTGVFYSQSKINAAATTFKGQKGYLVTITSADEDNFIFNNVPQSNIWFALTDSLTEGTWRIDDGPEDGTIVRIGTTNQQGVYNNWAGGEPNNWGGNEDYAVTKWGGSQWNDLNFNYNNPYVIEYGTWTNPDDQTFTDFYSNSVAHYNGVNNNLKSLFTFDFGGSLDETKFSAAIHKRTTSTDSWTTNTNVALNGLGKVLLTTQLDTAKVYSSAISIPTANDMQSYSTADIGKVYKMTITGNAGGAVWGTDIYTSDSYIPAAAVHAGIITAGQSKEVYIQIVEGLNNYTPSTRNGVTTYEWGGWGLSYKFVSAPNNSYKANTAAGQVEWCVIYDYDATNQRYRIGIDKREFDGTNLSPNNISRLKLFDLWDGEVTFKSEDIYWAEYWINTPTQFNFAGSSYSAKLRQANGFYGVSAEFTFTQLGSFKQHKFVFADYNSNELKTLYNSIVTVSDVYLAFKEYSEAGGLFGGGSGTQFGYGMQFINADVDDNKIFDERDCFNLLQYLTGVNDLVSEYKLDNTMKIVLDSTYSTITKLNWQQFPHYTGKEYGFSLVDGKTNYSYNLSVGWKGDVNLSHSAQQNIGNSKLSSELLAEINSSIMGEISADKVIVTISLDPLQQQVVGTQFQLNYDNTKLKFEKVDFVTNGTPSNYGTNRGNFINIGSLITNGDGILDNTTEYRVIFAPIGNITNILGLTSVSTTDAVNKDGQQLKIKLN